MEAQRQIIALESRYPELRLVGDLAALALRLVSEVEYVDAVKQGTEPREIVTELLENAFDRLAEGLSHFEELDQHGALTIRLPSGIRLWRHENPPEPPGPAPEKWGISF